ncbi:MAG: hypothetical protein K6U74_09290 [Firmicutes bacterium]|nr:hypothetical protein [Bacillota bacterium]
MNHEFLLAALGCGQYKVALDIAARHPFVVFGTMHGAAFRILAERGVPEPTESYQVYFYETG